MSANRTATAFAAILKMGVCFLLEPSMVRTYDDYLAMGVDISALRIVIAITVFGTGILNELFSGLRSHVLSYLVDLQSTYDKTYQQLSKLSSEREYRSDRRGATREIIRIETNLRCADLIGIVGGIGGWREKTTLRLSTLQHRALQRNA